MMKKVYLIRLEGGGDIDEKFVDEEAWNWITSRDPGYPSDHDGSGSWEDQLVPDSVRQAIEEQYCELLPCGAREEIMITSGSWENDRALHCPANAGVDLSMLDLGALRESLAAQGFEYTGAVFEGSIY